MCIDGSSGNLERIRATLREAPLVALRQLAAVSRRFEPVRAVSGEQYPVVAFVAAARREYTTGKARMHIRYRPALSPWRTRPAGPIGLRQALAPRDRYCVPGTPSVRSSPTWVSFQVIVRLTMSLAPAALVQVNSISTWRSD